MTTRETQKRYLTPPHEHHVPGSYFSVTYRLGATLWSTYTQFECHSLTVVSIKHPQVFTSRWSCITLEGRRFKREEIYGYLWLIPVEVWQKRKFCKAITFQLKNKLIKKKKKKMISLGHPAFLLVLGVRKGKTVWEQINPAGSKQVSLIHFGVWLNQGRF